MNVLKEYYPLYTEDYYIADLLGGRGGARSYALSQRALYCLLHEKEFRAFFLRQTQSTIYNSIWQDFKDRISEYQELHGVDLSNTIKFTDNKQGENQAVNLITGGVITTKGFQTSSGQHTATLKSLAGATHIFIDEAEEVDYDDFLKLKMSLRKKGVKIQIVRAFNPPHEQHWLWGDYNIEPINNNQLFELISKISDDDKTLIKELCDKNDKTFYRPISTKNDNHLMLMSNYFNNYENMNETALNDYEQLKHRNFYKYCTSVLGLIPKANEGTIFNNWVIGEFDDSLPFIYIQDWGTSDPHTLLKFAISKKQKRIYLHELHYKPLRNIGEVQNMYQKNGIKYTDAIVSDLNSNNELLREIGYNIIDCKKKPHYKAPCIMRVQDYTIVVTETSTNTIRELKSYCWSDKKSDTPQDGNDHTIDPMLYGKLFYEYEEFSNS